MARPKAVKSPQATDILKKRVRDAYQYFDGNYARYREWMRFIFDTSFTEEERENLRVIGKVPLEFNITEPFISRQLGEFAKQQPSLRVRNENDDPQYALPDGEKITQAQLVEGVLRDLLFFKHKYEVQTETYRESLCGGFSSIHVGTDYVSERSFSQEIKLKKTFDPTLVGFDPLARAPNKSDANYAFEFFPKTKEEFQIEFPKVNINNMDYENVSYNAVGGAEGFHWSFKQHGQEVIVVCDYYEKVATSETIHYLSTGDVVTDDQYKEILARYELESPIAPMPSIKNTRKVKKHFIDHYIFYQDDVLHYERTDYTYLPLVFVDGNSVMLSEPKANQNQQMTRPYVYQAKGAQKLKNIAGTTLGSELQNMAPPKMLLAEESLPDDALSQQAYREPQKVNVLTYKGFTEDGTAQTPAPREVGRQPTPPLIENTFAGIDKGLQSILGSYDASLGINDNQLSGTAIVEGATQSNAVAMPYIMNYMNSIQQIANIIIDLIPKYYTDERPLPIITGNGQHKVVQINQRMQMADGSSVIDPSKPNLIYDPAFFKLSVEPGVNFAVQKNRAVQAIMNLSMSMPMFSQFIQQEGMGLLLDNIDMKGVDQLILLWNDWQQEQKQKVAQQGQQPNPQQQQQELEQQKLSLQAQSEADKHMISQQKVNNDRLKIALGAHSDSVQNQLQANTTSVEEQRIQAEQMANLQKMEHSHTMDIHDRLNPPKSN